ncbi:MAG TPA: zf-TFIIB domain-containing protein [Terriglobia bacterium]|nr:zf-TFIIB domain-containing protein [Terriglobia bacterium]
MKCPNCSTEMAGMALEAHQGKSVVIDVCKHCQAFWFDKYESLQLSPGSTLKVMKFIGENSSSAQPMPQTLQCPRCPAHLVLTHDVQRNTKFSYWRCKNDHGKFIGFFDFLKEKNFVRQLSPKEIQDLRKNIQTVNCSNCGAPIDLATASACAHCGSPISILDMKQPQQMLAQLQQAAAPRPPNPLLPLELERAKRETESWFGPHESDSEWLIDASSGGLVQAGLNTVIRWLKNSGL